MLARARSYVFSAMGALHGPARQLAVLQMMNGIGDGLFTAGAAVYFIVVQGFSPIVIGIGLSLFGLSGFACNIVFGVAVDRIGAKRMLVAIELGLAVTYALFPFAHSIWLFFGLMMAAGGLDHGCAIPYQLTVGAIVPREERAIARASIRSFVNAGQTVGMMAAGLLLAVHSRIALEVFPVGNAVSFLIVGLYAMRLPSVHGSSQREEKLQLTAIRDLPFLAVVGASTLLNLSNSVLFVTVPLWLVAKTSISPVAIPIIFGVNTVMCIFLQVAFARDTPNISGALRAGRRAGWAGIVGCLLLMTAGILPLWTAVICLLLSSAVITCSELWQSASVTVLGYDLAPEATRGQYVGVFQLHHVIESTAAPAFTAFLVLTFGGWGWGIVGGLFALGAIVLTPAVRTMTRRPHLIGHAILPADKEVVAEV